MLKLAANELRNTVPDPEELAKIKKNPVYLIADNVLDTYNIGSIFRLADSVAATKVILCEGSETPPHTRIKKASINTTEWVDWEYFPTVIEAIKDLRAKVKGIQIIAVELDEKSKPYDQIEYKSPVALIVGHETRGLSQETMQLCDEIAEIPMWGVNKSINVVMSLGIVLFEAMKKIS
jgi:tRNA G18 (ribose-2'-O)-methylase SpoU